MLLPASLQWLQQRPLAHELARATLKALLAVTLVSLLLWALEALELSGRRAAARGPCPELHAVGSDGRRHRVPELLRLFPDHRRGEPPHPALYAERAEARQELGPLFWAKLLERGEPPCALVVGDAALGERLFHNDGIALSRAAPLPYSMERLKGAFDGMKFAVGEDWLRQRTALTTHVLDGHAKHARAVAAAPNASACLAARLWEHQQQPQQQGVVAAPVELSALLRQCMAEFMCSAVFGEAPWSGRGELVETLLACERSDCESRHGGAFSCLHKPVLREVERRLASHYRDADTPDPNRRSLLSSMLRRTKEAVHNRDVVGVGKGEALRVAEVASNAISFVAAGWETSTLTMINTLWPLTAWEVFPGSEEHQARVAAESAAARGGDSGLAAKLLAETLRWRPPVPWHGGNAVEDLQVEAHGLSYTVPKGSRLIVDIIAVNSLPSTGLVEGWDPEATSDAASERVEEHAGGLGSRHCPGGKVARHGMVTILSALLREWTLTLSSSRSSFNEEAGGTAARQSSSFDGWLQAYSGAFKSDLCGVLFRHPLWVHAAPR